MAEPVDSSKLFTARSRRAHGLVRPILLFMIAGALAQILVGLVTGGTTTILVSSFCGLVSIAGLFLVRAGHERTAALAALTAVMLGIEYAMWIGNGIHDIAAMELSVILLLAIVVLPQRLAIAFHLVMLVTVGIIGVAEQQRWLPDDNVIMADAADAYLAVVILAALGGLLHYLVYTLARSEQSYAEVFNATHEAIFVHDAQTARILDVNDAMRRMYGYARQGVGSFDVAQLCTDDPEFSADRFHERIKNAAGGEQIFEWKARRKDGTEFWVEVTLRRSDIAGQGRVLAVVRDIDTRKHAEGRTRRAEKLRALGQLAGGIAHDFNNQLAGIAGYAELLALERSDLPDVVERTGHILNATDHAANLTRQLLAFAREESQQSEHIDLNSLTADVVEMVRRSIDRAVAVEFEPAPTRLVVRVDRAQAHSAILNLCLNARDAMPNGGKLTISTSTLELDNDQATRGDEGSSSSERTRPDEPPTGRYALVEVADDGVGMSDSIRERIFEPFFTTKPRGTGMGLATVYGTARGHGGFVDVRSEVGAGSQFRLAFPLEEGATPSTWHRSRTRQGELGLRVLVAEDEPIVAQMTRTLLEQLGCIVHGCGDGEQAVEAFRNAPAEFDAVLLDLSMPRLSGADALRELRRIDAATPVVIMSGYTADTSVQSLHTAGAAGFLAKPFTLEALRSVLSSAVGERQPAKLAGEAD
jgi:PAS domain S-box-containing protein